MTDDWEYFLFGATEFGDDTWEDTVPIHLPEEDGFYPILTEPPQYIEEDNDAYSFLPIPRKDLFKLPVYIKVLH